MQLPLGYVYKVHKTCLTLYLNLNAIITMCHYMHVFLIPQISELQNIAKHVLDKAYLNVYKVQVRLVLIQETDENFFELRYFSNQERKSYQSNGWSIQKTQGFPKKNFYRNLCLERHENCSQESELDVTLVGQSQGSKCLLSLCSLLLMCQKFTH